MRKLTWITLSTVASALVLIGSEVPLRADVIFTNLGSAQSFNPSGYLLSQPIAFSFVPTYTATLTDAMLALQQLTEGTLSVYVESNSGGEPGTILDSLTQVGSVPTTAALVEFTCPMCSVLQSGTTYWMVVAETLSDPVGLGDAWNWSPSETGTLYYSTSGSSTGPWSSEGPTVPFSAFQVDGTATETPVPEPGSVALFATGLAGLLILGVRRSDCDYGHFGVVPRNYWHGRLESLRAMHGALKLASERRYIVYRHSIAEMRCRLFRLGACF